MSETNKGIQALIMSTLAFTVCFAVWMMNGVLVTFLVENRIFSWDQSQLGWLIGIPVLTGSVMRLPVGLLTDRYGGRIVFTIVMLVSAAATFSLSYANSFASFALCSLGFGVVGASFAVGIAYSSLWFPKEKQGTALGIFGAGNAGAALTSLGAPHLLKFLTQGGEHLENWRMFPKMYAVGLLAMAVLFYLLTHHKIVEGATQKTLLQNLSPLKNIRVWRFGLYYFFVFGGFVALAQWLIPYYVNVYVMSLATAGMMAAIFSLPSGVIRALGGWMSDRFGARRVMYWVFGSCLVCCILLVVPRMDIYSPGSGVLAAAAGTVSAVNDTSVVIGEKTYPFKPKTAAGDLAESSVTPPAGVLVLPRMQFWQEAVVKVDEAVKKKQMLARGITHVYFQANVWIFTFLVFVVGIMMGIGKAAVYKHIPDYFPKEVGVVGGMVGVLGGLGGFFCPIIFGYFLKSTGIWTTCWMFFAGLIIVSLGWMHAVIQKMMRQREPSLMRRFERES